MSRSEGGSQYSCGLIEGLVMMWKPDTRADFELFSPYFNSNEITVLSHIQYSLMYWRLYFWCHGSIQNICGPTRGPLMIWKLYMRAHFELFSPYFSPNLQLNHINYQFYHMYSTLWCIWDYTWCHRSIWYTCGPAGGLVMMWKLDARADFELFSPYFSP